MPLTGRLYYSWVELMANLIIDDFRAFSLTCELRYMSAYLIYDRTGQVLEDLRKTFTNIAVSAASPPQTSFVAAEGSFTLELGACRFTTNRLDKNGETFAKHCAVFFDVVIDQLGINVFTRLGLRYIARKEFKTLDEAKAALAALTLANLKPTRRFNSSESPIEVMFRWEDAEIGAFVRLRAESVDIKFDLDPRLCDGDQECCLAAELKSKRDLLEALRGAIPQNSTRREDQKRRQALKQLLKHPKEVVSRETCRDLGDAIFAFFCPDNAVVLTTNLRDHDPLAKAIGKKAESP